MSNINKIRVGGVDYNISPDLTNYAKKSEIDSLISEVQTKEYYYNDGSNEVVPVKWPDLSTQPSILPYKFMGQYVYEQLLPINSRDGEYGMDEPSFNLVRLECSNPIFLDACAISTGHFSTVHIYVDSGFFIVRIPTGEYSNYEYIRVVYTSMPEKNVSHYYNDYYNDNYDNYYDIYDDYNDYYYDDDYNDYYYDDDYNDYYYDEDYYDYYYDEDYYD